ncbi:MAG TPA: glycine cleavage T C-terminal barrel domain-containing protein [Lacipirellulaceae bacterium]|nr:glycine cleavage T C-terminal barrel domain-containing protein [Lacipirellulaceae bacterium]
MIESYPVRQYQALWRGNAVVPLRGWSSISIGGKDRHAFLHNFCTNDVKRLTIGASCEAFITSVKGKSIGHGFVGCLADELIFIGAPGQAAAIVAHLDRYIIREDVQLADTTETRSHLLQVGNVAPPTNGFSINGLTPTTGWIVSFAPEADSAIVAGLVGVGFVAVEEPAFNIARIEMGFPLFGVDFDENNLPQEVGRDREAISFTKGCYLGQETVARIDALGHVNQRIVGVRFLANIMPADACDLTQAGAVVGRVTSADYSLEVKSPLGVAMVRRDANSIGTRLMSAVGDCEVTEFPGRKLVS